ILLLIVLPFQCSLRGRAPLPRAHRPLFLWIKKTQTPLAAGATIMRSAATAALLSGPSLEFAAPHVERRRQSFNSSFVPTA
ncbi:MAG: hypothetical protein WB760_32010, partial [Xanthobacteraceae bacterium]